MKYYDEIRLFEENTKNFIIFCRVEIVKENIKKEKCWKARHFKWP